MKIRLLLNSLLFADTKKEANSAQDDFSLKFLSFLFSFPISGCFPVWIPNRDDKRSSAVITLRGPFSLLHTSLATDTFDGAFSSIHRLPSTFLSMCTGSLLSKPISLFSFFSFLINTSETSFITFFVWQFAFVLFYCETGWWLDLTLLNSVSSLNPPPFSFWYAGFSLNLQR